MMTLELVFRGSLTLLILNLLDVSPAFSTLVLAAVLICVLLIYRFLLIWS